MNSYTDKDLNKIAFLSVIGFSITVSLLFTVVPFLEKQRDTINQLENRIKIIENTYQKSQKLFKRENKQ